MAGTPGLTAPADSPELEARLAAVESRLAALGNALRARDPVAIDLQASELHRALAAAVSHFSDAPATARCRRPCASAWRRPAARSWRSASRWPAPPPRSTGALDVLLPREGTGLYSIYGAADRGMYKSGVIRA
jgi:hypothetical protein